MYFYFFVIAMKLSCFWHCTYSVYTVLYINVPIKVFCVQYLSNFYGKNKREFYK